MLSLVVGGAAAVNAIAPGGGLPRIEVVAPLTDHAANDDAHALAIARHIVANLNRVKQPGLAVQPAREPAYDPAELYGVIPAAWTAIANGHNSGMPAVFSAPRSPYSRAIRALAAKLLPEDAADGAETKSSSLPALTRLMAGLRRTAV